MKKTKVFSVLLLVVYLFISQFIVKAWVTTDRTLATSETFCVNKKLDTFDSKTGCWKKNMSAFFVAEIVEVPQSIIAYTSPGDFLGCKTCLITESLLERTTRPPPHEHFSGKLFSESYIGITVLVL